MSVPIFIISDGILTDPKGPVSINLLYSGNEFIDHTGWIISVTLGDRVGHGRREFSGLIKQYLVQSDYFLDPKQLYYGAGQTILSDAAFAAFRPLVVFHPTDRKLDVGETMFVGDVIGYY